MNANNPVCFSQDGVTKITVVTTPTAQFDPIGQFGGSVINTFTFKNQSLNASSYFWYFFDGEFSTEVSPIHTFPQAENYDVTLVASQLGCADTIVKEICVDELLSVFIPNTFCPDGNGYNEVFEMYGNKSVFRTFNIKIYNRIGELVFESDDENFAWDGRNKGIMCIPQVFVYVIDAAITDCSDKENDGTHYSWKGSITLLR